MGRAIGALLVFGVGVSAGHAFAPGAVCAQPMIPSPEGISLEVLRGALEPADRAPVLPPTNHRAPTHAWLRERGLEMGRRFRPDAFAALLSRLEHQGAPAAALNTLRRYSAPRPRPMLSPFVPRSHQTPEQNSWLNAPALFEGVVVRATLDRHGRVIHTQVIRSSGSPELDAVAQAELARDEPERPPPPELLSPDGTVAADWLFEMAHVGIPLTETLSGGGGHVGLPFGIVADLADLAEGRAQPVIAGQGYVRTRVRCLGRVPPRPAVEAAEAEAARSAPPAGD